MAKKHVLSVGFLLVLSGATFGFLAQRAGQFSGIEMYARYIGFASLFFLIGLSVYSRIKKRKAMPPM